MTYKDRVVRYKKELIGGAVGALIMILLWLFLFYLPKPTLIDPPSSTKESKISLNGKAAPHVGIVAYDQAGNALVAVNTDGQGAFSLANLPIGEGMNVFYLRAVKSDWKASFALKLGVLKDTTAPALSVNSLSGATVTGSNTVVSGKAEPGSTVTVNGVKTAVNPDGTWSATVALQPGTNKVSVAATDAAGNTTTQTQTVQYTPASAGSQTGMATVATSTTAVSAGSQPAGTATSTSSGTTASTSPSTVTATSSVTVTSSPTPTASPSPSPTPAPAPAPTPAPAPAPQPVLAIVTTAWVSNSSPNSRANETIYASVKDNYGRAVSNASVIAVVSYPSGSVSYSLSSMGGGQYAVSFKLNDKYLSGVRDNVSVTARYDGYVSTASTSFTPL